MLWVPRFIKLQFQNVISTTTKVQSLLVIACEYIIFFEKFNNNIKTAVSLKGYRKKILLDKGFVLYKTERI